LGALSSPLYQLLTFFLLCLPNPFPFSFRSISSKSNWWRVFVLEIVTIPNLMTDMSQIESEWCYGIQSIATFEVSP
jgi:hypothetical protein